MIEVRPDPAHPHGGFALIETAAGALGESVEVEVFDSFAARYLGPGGWQATRFAFGPYPVEHGAVADSLRVGPEIVNQLSEYQPLRLGLGAVSAELSWPDDVVPDADAAISGGLQTISAPPAKPAPPPAPPKPAAPEAAFPAPAESLPASEPEAPPPVVDPAPRRAPLLLGGLILLALLAAGAAYLLTRPAPEPAPAPTPPVAEEAPPPPPPGPDCSPDALAALGARGFGPVAARLGDCGNAVTQDQALGLIETAAQAGVPAALTLFGRLYDAEATDAPLETGLGLTFSDSPARAAEYYDRAKQAGSAEAAPLLAAVCQRLAAMTDTLSQSAHEDHCGS